MTEEDLIPEPQTIVRMKLLPDSCVDLVDSWQVDIVDDEPAHVIEDSVELVKIHKEVKRLVDDAMSACAVLCLGAPDNVLCATIREREIAVFLNVYENEAREILRRVGVDIGSVAVERYGD